MTLSSKDEITNLVYVVEDDNIERARYVREWHPADSFLGPQVDFDPSTTSGPVNSCVDPSGLIWQEDFGGNIEGIQQKNLNGSDAAGYISLMHINDGEWVANGAAQIVGMDFGGDDSEEVDLNLQQHLWVLLRYRDPVTFNLIDELHAYEAPNEITPTIVRSASSVDHNGINSGWVWNQDGFWNASSTHILKKWSKELVLMETIDTTNFVLSNPASQPWIAYAGHNKLFYTNQAELPSVYVVDTETGEQVERYFLPVDATEADRQIQYMFSGWTQFADVTIPPWLRLNQRAHDTRINQTEVKTPRIRQTGRIV